MLNCIDLLKVSYYRILVTGTREELTQAEKDLISVAIEEAAMRDYQKHQRPCVVVHGGCRTGVDQYVEETYADVDDSNLSVESHPADWSLGKKAGPLRNQAMVDLGADICLAFPRPDSKGTRHCAKAAIDAGIETIITEL